MAKTDTFAAEYAALTEGAALLDRSQRGKLALTGAQAQEFLTGQVSNDILGLEPGQGCYAAFLTPKGKMLGDLRACNVGSELLLDTERERLQELFNLIHRFKIGFDVELHKRTLERGLLSLIGPRAEAVVDAPTLPEAEHANSQVTVDGIDTLAIRTDTGIDLVCDSADTARVATALVEHGAQSVCEQSAECLRVELGRPRYGPDLDDTVIPQEAGLNDRAVSFTKGCYVGQETVARLFYRGKPNRQLRGLLLSQPAPAGAALSNGERTLGRLGSSVVSPVLGPIALALVRREAQVGARVAVEGGASATVVTLPFDRPAG